MFVTVGDQGGNILPAFENLFDGLVQSNNTLPAEGILVVRVVHDQRGGYKCKLEKTLDSEVICKRPSICCRGQK